mmetsp:Transcript_10120/g.26251  ORF Transcript_10120/g.26251 Transcript_10120/m.26251 type:complete len:255 (-) Transcript_10120:330-1094(-)
MRGRGWPGRGRRGAPPRARAVPVVRVRVRVPWVVPRCPVCWGQRWRRGQGRWWRRAPRRAVVPLDAAADARALEHAFDDKAPLRPRVLPGAAEVAVVVVHPLGLARLAIHGVAVARLLGRRSVAARLAVAPHIVELVIAARDEVLVVRHAPRLTVGRVLGSALAVDVTLVVPALKATDVPRSCALAIAKGRGRGRWGRRRRAVATQTAVLAPIPIVLPVSSRRCRAPRPNRPSTSARGHRALLIEWPHLVAALA